MIELQMNMRSEEQLYSTFLGKSVKKLENVPFNKLCCAETPAELTKYGLTPKESEKMISVVELSRRLASQSALQKRKCLRSAEDIAAFIGPRLKYKLHEEFWVLVLNTHNDLIATKIIAKGILNACVTHPREVFRPAILEGGASIIIVHNHPSGDSMPSNEDREITKQLKESGEILKIPLHDHIIIGDNYYSFLEAGEI